LNLRTAPQESRAVQVKVPLASFKKLNTAAKGTDDIGSGPGVVFTLAVDADERSSRVDFAILQALEKVCAAQEGQDLMM
jgi:hypothetical protein